ncbi:MAG: hypothetical protein Q4B34_01420 [Candidatus Saccharibacteria bacterium]|nr:hypothetical protein [Candidatus Saccharibacteria bacterium]
MTQDNHSQQFCSTRERLSGELYTFDLGSNRFGILDCAEQKFKILARSCENHQIVDPKTAGTLHPSLDMVILTDENLRHDNHGILFGYDRVDPDMILGVQEGNPSVLIKSADESGAALLPSAILAVEKITINDQRAATKFGLPIVVIYPASDTLTNENYRSAYKPPSFLKRAASVAAAMV